MYILYHIVSLCINIWMTAYPYIPVSVSSGIKTMRSTDTFRQVQECGFHHCGPAIVFCIIRGSQPCQCQHLQCFTCFTNCVFHRHTNLRRVRWDDKTHSMQADNVECHKHWCNSETRWAANVIASTLRVTQPHTTEQLRQLLHKTTLATYMQ